MHLLPAWTTHPATLLAPLLIAWLATRRREEQPAEAWHPWIDPALAAASGLCLALVCFYWASDFTLRDGDVLTADLSDYCKAVQSARTPGSPHYPVNRSPAIGALIGPLAVRLGIMGALQAAAVASSAVLGAALFVWGRAATDRRAGGIAAVILALAAQPLVTLGRQLNFYPETTAAAAVGAAAVALALRSGAPATLLAGGVGAGLVLVVDPRLLPLGLALAVAALVAAIPGPLRRAPLRIGLAMAPVIASWWVPRALLRQGPGPLRAHEAGGYLSLMFGVFTDHDRQLAQHLVQPVPPVDLAWGFTKAREVLPALDLLHQLSRTALDPHLLTEEVISRQGQQPALLAVVGALGLVGAGASWRTPRRLLAGSLLPALFLGHLLAALHVLPRARTAAAGSLAIPILLVTGLWAVGPRKAPPWVGAVVALLLALASAGLFPSGLHPQASWRVPRRLGFVHQDAWTEQLTGIGRESLDCARGLAQDAERGLLLPWPGPRVPPPTPPGPPPR